MQYPLSAKVVRPRPLSVQACVPQPTLPAVIFQHNCSSVVQLITHHQQRYEAVLTAKVGDETEELYWNKSLDRRLRDWMRREIWDNGSSKLCEISRDGPSYFPVQARDPASYLFFETSLRSLFNGWSGYVTELCCSPIPGAISAVVHSPKW